MVIVIRTVQFCGIAGLLLLVYQMASCAMRGARDVVKPSIDQGSFPFYLAGAVGFVLLFISMRVKNAGALIVGVLGAALVAAAFSHWLWPN